MSNSSQALLQYLPTWQSMPYAPDPFVVKNDTFSIYVTGQEFKERHAHHRDNTFQRFNDGGELIAELKESSKDGPDGYYRPQPYGLVEVRLAMNPLSKDYVQKVQKGHEKLAQIMDQIGDHELTKTIQAEVEALGELIKLRNQERIMENPPYIRLLYSSKDLADHYLNAYKTDVEIGKLRD